jgi:hypothetical protein
MSTSPALIFGGVTRFIWSPCSLCVCVSSPIIARKRAVSVYVFSPLLLSFYVRSVSYQRITREKFFSELLVVYNYFFTHMFAVVPVFAVIYPVAPVWHGNSSCQANAPSASKQCPILLGEHMCFILERGVFQKVDVAFFHILTLNMNLFSHFSDLALCLTCHKITTLLP